MQEQCCICSQVAMMVTAVCATDSTDNTLHFAVITGNKATNAQRWHNS